MNRAGRFLWSNRKPILISGTLGLASDATCQMIQNGMSQFDFKRSARFASIWFSGTHRIRLKKNDVFFLFYKIQKVEN